MTSQTWSAPVGETDAAWLRWANELPLVRELGLRCTHIADGRASFRLDVVPMTPNPNGSVNGGLVAAAVDQVMGAVAMRAVPEGCLVNTASLSVHYQRPARPPLTFAARVTKHGRSLVFVSVEVIDDAGRTTNTGTGTMMVLRYAN